MKKLKLGYAPTRRFVFSAEDVFKYNVQIRECVSITSKRGLGNCYCLGVTRERNLCSRSGHSIFW